MSATGRAILTSALKRIGMVDPTQDPNAELLDEARAIAADLIDEWRTHKLTISGVTIASYSLASGQQTRTIGVGGNFNQAWPTAIELWSVIPDDTAASPQEIPMGRPVAFDHWQGIRVKSQTAAYPRVMHYDGTYAAGLGNCLFWPIPDNGNVDVKLYAHVPAVTTLELDTDYDLRPGLSRALKLNLAVEFGEAFGRSLPQGLEMRAKDALGSVKRHNIIPRESSMRADFAVGQGGRRRSAPNLYTGS